MNITSIKKMGGSFSMRDASFTTRWVAETSIRLMCVNSDVKIW